MPEDTEYTLEIPDELRKQMQRAFGVAVKGILDQGCASMDDAGDCMYRSTVNGKVCKCAIGHLIPDDKYIPDIEGLGIQNLLGKWPNKLDCLGFDMETMANRHFRIFLGHLQSCHDDSAHESPQSDLQFLRDFVESAWGFCIGS